MSLTFKQRDKVIKKYAYEYNKSKIIELKGTKLIDDIINESHSRYIDSLNKYRYYYSLQEKIDLILEKLDWECSNFLKREFFSDNLKKDWWMNFYSRSTYYRLKEKSMRQFMELLYA